ncbi:MAG: UvrD-helicase domain-containing protein [Gammaproteobacteria bacterium]|jgi:ATP-dependent DNA helicase Rep
MSKLNAPQHKAVHHIEGPLLVLAGAGSGKTSVITQKIVYLIQECGIAPSKIAAVTFTNKAAKEMKSRVTGRLSKKDVKGLTVSTFHTLGLKILRKEHKQLGYKSRISIYDSQDSQLLLKQLASNALLKAIPVEQAQQQISLWKNAAITPEVALSTQCDTAIKQDLAGLYAAYCHQLKVYNAVDFDDLICLPVALFESNPEVLERWQNKIRYLLVDEYQDTNAVQYQLVKLLVGPRASLTVVGDDDQSIYAWRGACPENLAQLKNDFHNLTVVKLEQNYRSTSCILKAANGLITNNPHVFRKNLWSEFGFGDPVKVIEARDEEHEAERVVSHLLNHQFQKRTAFRDYAILYRGNHQSRLFEQCLREHKIPYRITGGTSFFALTEVKDIMAYLRLLANNDDDQAFLRVVNTPRREIGPSTLEKLVTYANKRGVSLCEAGYEMGLSQYLAERPLKRVRRFIEWIAYMSDRMERGDLVSALNDLVDEIGYKDWLEDICRDIPSAERKLENVYELLGWLEHYIESTTEELNLAQLVQQMTLIDMLDKDGDDESEVPNCVHLLTLHSAKGLEFQHVYMVGMEENLLPHYASVQEENVDEERRLAYVGITRAQRTLTFSLAAKRKRNGEVIPCEPSRFLDELPEDTIVWEKHQKQDPEQRQQTGQAHLANLRGLLGEA